MKRHVVPWMLGRDENCIHYIYLLISVLGWESLEPSVSIEADSSDAHTEGPQPHLRTTGAPSKRTAKSKLRVNVTLYLTILRKKPGLREKSQYWQNKCQNCEILSQNCEKKPYINGIFIHNLRELDQLVSLIGSDLHIGSISRGSLWTSALRFWRRLIRSLEWLAGNQVR